MVYMTESLMKYCLNQMNEAGKEQIIDVVFQLILS